MKLICSKINKKILNNNNKIYKVFNQIKTIQ